MDGNKNDGSPFWAKDDRIHMAIVIVILIVIAVAFRLFA